MDAAAAGFGIAGGAVRLAGYAGKLEKDVAEGGDLLLGFNSLGFAIPGEIYSVNNYVSESSSGVGPELPTPVSPDCNNTA
ncbi:MAG TPA: hypothetical protein VFI97_02035 [Arthrobacter sp.]|nr:hypothetical protein [Arthrobacter sp.]